MIARWLAFLCLLLTPVAAQAVPPPRAIIASGGQPQFIPPTLTNSGQNWNSTSQLINTTWTVENANGVNNNLGKAPYAFLVAGQFNADVQRFQVKCGDASWVDTSGPCPTTKVRSELDGFGNTNVPLSTDQWVSYALYMAPGRINASANQWYIQGQFHDLECSGVSGESPPLALSVDASGTLRAQYLYNQVNCDPNPQGSNTHFFNTALVTNFARGVWHNIVMQVNIDWSTGGTGKANIWVDGVQVLAYVGPLGYNGAQIASYFKYGIYADGQQVGTSYYANMEVTCTTTLPCPATSLASRITAPLPIPPVRID